MNQAKHCMRWRFNLRGLPLPLEQALLLLMKMSLQVSWGQRKGQSVCVCVCVLMLEAFWQCPFCKLLGFSESWISLGGWTQFLDVDVKNMGVCVGFLYFPGLWGDGVPQARSISLEEMEGQLTIWKLTLFFPLQPSFQNAPCESLKQGAH